MRSLFPLFYQSPNLFGDLFWRGDEYLFIAIELAFFEQNGTFRHFDDAGQSNKRNGGEIDVFEGRQSLTQRYQHGSSGFHYRLRNQVVKIRFAVLKPHPQHQNQHI